MIPSALLGITGSWSANLLCMCILPGRGAYRRYVSPSYMGVYHDLPMHEQYSLTSLHTEVLGWEIMLRTVMHHSHHGCTAEEPSTCPYFP